MKQGTQEWLEMRTNYVMASDAPIIMGVSPWRTPNQLWKEKLGIGAAQKETMAMREGKIKELNARLAYQVYTGVSVRPDVVYHPSIKYMGASLDGISLKKRRLVELKNPGAKDHQLAKEGKVPDKYKPQLQHQLSCVKHLDIDVVDYFSFRDNEGILIEVGKDEEYLEELYAEEGIFWDKVLNLDAPAFTDKDYADMEKSRKWKVQADRWNDIFLQTKALKEEEVDCRKKLISLAGDGNAIGHGIRLAKIMRKGTVDYKAIPELKEVNLESYRKKPIETWRLESTLRA